MASALNILTTKNNSGAFLETMTAAEVEHEKAIQYVEMLSDGVGGRGTGESLLSDGAAEGKAKALCPNPSTFRQCLEARAYDACYLEKNGPKCREMSMLLGTTLEQAAKVYLAATRTSDTDNYFLQPTRNTAPKVVSKEVAALLIAAGTAKR